MASNGTTTESSGVVKKLGISCIIIYYFVIVLLDEYDTIDRTQNYVQCSTEQYAFFLRSLRLLRTGVHDCGRVPPYTVFSTNRSHSYFAPKTSREFLIIIYLSRTRYLILIEFSYIRADERFWCSDMICYV